MRTLTWLFDLSVQLDIYEITLWFQLEDMFQSIVTPQGIEKVTIQLIDTPTKVYAIGARLILSKVPIEVLLNWVRLHKCRYMDPMHAMGAKLYLLKVPLEVLQN